MVGCRKCPPWVQGGHFAVSWEALFVEGRVGEIYVFLVHLLFGQFDGFAEALEMDNLPFPEEANDVIYVRVVGQAKDVVIGEAGLLLCGDRIRTTSSVFRGIQLIRDAVNFVLQAF